jgi:hypothetical protein
VRRAEKRPRGDRRLEKSGKKDEGSRLLLIKYPTPAAFLLNFCTLVLCDQLSTGLDITYKVLIKRSFVRM